MDVISDYSEIEQYTIACVKQLQPTCTYEVKKALTKIGISERKVLMCLKYLLKKGILVNVSRNKKQFEYNQSYVEKTVIGKPCKLCETTRAA
jgi:uncharacterized protein YcgI (DUF1989 family)